MWILNFARRSDLSESPGDGPIRVVTEAWFGRTAGYLARVDIATRRGSPLYDLDRIFLEPADDRRSRFGNGLLIFEVMEPGIYEVDSRWHRNQVRRHWFHIDAQGQVQLLASRDEALAKLWGFDRVEELAEARMAAWEQRMSEHGWYRRVAQAAAANAMDGLPSLDGSSAQIAYAEVIRHRRLREAEQRTRPRELRHLRGVTSAAWWIMHRRWQLRRLVQAATAWQRDRTNLMGLGRSAERNLRGTGMEVK